MPELNVPSRTLFTADNLPVLRCINDQTIDLIYLDPPFNTGKRWGNPVQAGGKRALVTFEDTWKWGDEHEDLYWELKSVYPSAAILIDGLAAVNGESWRAYLVYMAVRLVEMKRVLKPTGSIYYHCDSTMSHGVKMIMDAIFGKECFMNEIVWERMKGAKGTKGKARRYPRNTDTILFYGMPESEFVSPYKELSESTIAAYTKIDSDGRRYHLDNISNPGGGGYIYDLGFGEKLPSRGYYMIEETAREWLAQGILVVRKGKVPCKKRYLDESKGVQVSNLWTDIQSLRSRSKEWQGYPTQKPLALLVRIIKTSSNGGDIVLDPFCGCATTCVAAETLDRHWIGIDVSDKAIEILKDRLSNMNPTGKREEKQLQTFVVNSPKSLPVRTDLPRLRDKAQLRKELYKKQDKKCIACGAEKELVDMDLDHIIPKARGGQDIEYNLQMLCRNCNTKKGSGTMAKLMRKLSEMRQQEQAEKDQEDYEKRRKERK